MQATQHIHEFVRQGNRFVCEDPSCHARYNPITHGADTR